MRYGAYHRISRTNGRDFDADNTMSDKDAFEQIDAWAQMRSAEIVERYLDKDESGSKLKRPELDRMLADLDAGVIDGIVVAQVDRLSRADVGDALTVVKKIIGDDEAHKRPLVLLDLGIDPSTEFGEFGLTILLGLARMQWRRYKRTWTTAQKRAVARGVWIGPAPFGYRSTIASWDRKGNPVPGPLEPDEHFETMTQAFKIAAADGLHPVMSYLQGKAPERRWTTNEVRRLLKCRAYLGEVKYGDLPITRGAHPAATTRALYEAAQTEPRARRPNGDYVLSQVATCHCGGNMVGGLQTVKGKTYRRMRCSTCERTSISAEAIEGYVRETVREALGNRVIRDRFDVRGLADARERLRAAEDDLTDWTSDLDLRRDIGADAVKAGARARAKAVEAARVALSLVGTKQAQERDLPAAHEVDDDAKLLRAIRAMVASIVVSAGRGSVEDRVLLRWQDVDDVAGTLAA